MVRPALLAFGSLLAALLSGCSSDPGEDRPTAPAATLLPGPDSDAPAGSPGLEVVPTALAAPVRLTVWANGTVAPQDTCDLGGCTVANGGGIRVTDLTPSLPSGSPVRIQAYLDYEPIEVAASSVGSFSLHLEAPDSVAYVHRVEGRPGHTAIEAVLLPQGTVQLVFRATTLGGEAPETPYTLRAVIEADPQWLPEGVPAAVPLRGGSSVEVVSDPEDPPFHLFAPDGRRLGIFTGKQTLPADAPAGEYAVLVPGDLSAAQVRTDAGGTLRPLALRIEAGPAAVLSPGEGYSGEWEVAGDPIALGARSRSPEGTADVSPFASAGYRMLLTGPEGFRLGSPDLCGFCAGSHEFSIASVLGEPSAQAGAYTLEVEDTGTVGLEVEPFAVHIVL